MIIPLPLDNCIYQCIGIIICQIGLKKCLTVGPKQIWWKISSPFWVIIGSSRSIVVTKTCFIAAAMIIPMNVVLGAASLVIIWWIATYNCIVFLIFNTTQLQWVCVALNLSFYYPHWSQRFAQCAHQPRWIYNSFARVQQFYSGINQARYFCIFLVTAFHS